MDKFIKFHGFLALNVIIRDQLTVIIQQYDSGARWTRQKYNLQINLFTTMARIQIAKELQQMSHIFDATHKVVDLAYQGLARSSRPTTGRDGMTAEQVLHYAILKQYSQLTCEELTFHLEDSEAFRVFSLLEMGQYPCKSILQENIKALQDETWVAIYREILD